MVVTLLKADAATQKRARIALRMAWWNFRSGEWVWVNRCPAEDSEDCQCIMTALCAACRAVCDRIGHVMDREAEYPRVVEQARAWLSEYLDMPAWRIPGDWNDQPDRTKEDVVRALAGALTIGQTTA